MDTKEVRKLLAKALHDHGLEPGNADDGEVRVVYMTVDEDGNPHIQVQDQGEELGAILGVDEDEVEDGSGDQGSSNAGMQLSPDMIARALNGESIEQILDRSDDRDHAAGDRRQQQQQQQQQQQPPVSDLPLTDATGNNGVVDEHRNDVGNNRIFRDRPGGGVGPSKKVFALQRAQQQQQLKQLTQRQAEQLAQEQVRQERLLDAEFEARFFDGFDDVDGDWEESGDDVDSDPENDRLWSLVEQADTARTENPMAARRLFEQVIDDQRSSATEATGDLDSVFFVPPADNATLAALYGLGEMAEWGEGGLPLNWTLARSLYQQAADGGHADAQAALAQFYALARGHPYPDSAMAVLYYTMAAQGGSAAAQLTLGYRYLYGHGVAKSCERAFDYYDLVASTVVQEIERTGLQPAGLGHRLGSAELQQTKQQVHKTEALDYYQYSAQRGDAQAKVNLGTLYLDGTQGVERDLQRALNFFQDAADMGDPSGLAQLGFMYEKGYADMVAAQTELAAVTSSQTNNNGGGDDPTPTAPTTKSSSSSSSATAASSVDDALIQRRQRSLERRALHGRPDRERARTLYELALHAQPKNAVAQALLGIMELEDGNLSRAKTLLKSAAAQGRADAQLQMGHFYFNGDAGIPRNYNQALQQYAVSAHAGNTAALYFLAHMHRDGLGTSQDCKSASLLLKRVAERGLRADLLEAPYDCWVQDGDLTCALFGYELAAEQGVELAMANTAYLYESLATGSLDEPQVFTTLFNTTTSTGTGTASSSNSISRLKSNPYAAKALHWYKLAAEQQNAGAHLKAGDAYYYGLGTNRSVSLASKYYQAASDLRSAQATFNLGYMQQHGIGLPQDFHLAKRYYDLAADLNEDALPAVWLALVGLLAHAWALRLYRMSLPEYDGIEIGLGPDFRLEWDTVLICFLSFVLVLLWKIRSGHRQQNLDLDPAAD